MKELLLNNKSKILEFTESKISSKDICLSESEKKNEFETRSFNCLNSSFVPTQSASVFRITKKLSSLNPSK